MRGTDRPAVSAAAAVLSILVSGAVGSSDGGSPSCDQDDADKPGAGPRTHRLPATARQAPTCSIPAAPGVAAPGVAAPRLAAPGLAALGLAVVGGGTFDQGRVGVDSPGSAGMDGQMVPGSRRDEAREKPPGCGAAATGAHLAPQLRVYHRPRSRPTLEESAAMLFRSRTAWPSVQCRSGCSVPDAPDRFE